MQYHNITKDDMLNGDGLRVVLWVAGCGHACPGCHNPVTWDENGGLPFDEAAKQELFGELSGVPRLSDDRDEPVRTGMYAAVERLALWMSTRLQAPPAVPASRRSHHYLRLR